MAGLAGAENKSFRSNDAKARAPNPVVLRARKARRHKTVFGSDARLMTGSIPKRRKAERGKRKAEWALLITPLCTQIGAVTGL